MNWILVHLSKNMRFHYPTFMKNTWILPFPLQKSDICRNGKRNPFLVYCANSIVPHKSNYSRATASDLLLATLRGVLFLKDLAKKFTLLQKRKSNKSQCRSKIQPFSNRNLLGSGQIPKIPKKYREKLRFLNYFWFGESWSLFWD